MYSHEKRYDMCNDTRKPGYPSHGKQRHIMHIKRTTLTITFFILYYKQVLPSQYVIIVMELPLAPVVLPVLYPRRQRLKGLFGHHFPHLHSQR